MKHCSVLFAAVFSSTGDGGTLTEATDGNPRMNRTHEENVILKAQTGVWTTVAVGQQEGFVLRHFNCVASYQDYFTGMMHMTWCVM